MKNSIRLVLLLVSLGLAPGALAAQVYTPAYLQPRSPDFVGAAVSGGLGSTDGYAIEAMARRDQGSFVLEMRAGVADLDGVAALVGLQAAVPFQLPEAPVDLAAVGAVQGIIGSGGGTAFAGGVTAGKTFDVPGVLITPYVLPRLGVSSLDDGLLVMLEAGADFAIASDVFFHLALGAGNGTSALGFGLSWRP